MCSSFKGKSRNRNNMMTAGSRLRQCPHPEHEEAEQPEQELDEEEEEECSGPPPMLKVLNRRSTRAQEHLGQAGFFARELRSRSSKR
jgi:hypothetical protein